MESTNAKRKDSLESQIKDNKKQTSPRVIDSLTNDTSKINLNPDIKLKEGENISNISNISSQISANEDQGVREVRVATIGNVDSGKSTLVGVLTKCVLDDGRGYARQLVFNFDHEKQNGRTSSVTQEIMGFKETKQVEPHKTTDKKNNLWGKIVKDSDKIISLIDLCGHEKYLKTTIFGLTGSSITLRRF